VVPHRDAAVQDEDGTTGCVGRADDVNKNTRGGVPDRPRSRSSPPCLGSSRPWPKLLRSPQPRRLRGNVVRLSSCSLLLRALLGARLRDQTHVRTTALRLRLFRAGLNSSPSADDVLTERSAASSCARLELERANA